MARRRTGGWAAAMALATMIAGCSAPATEGSGGVEPAAQSGASSTGGSSATTPPSSAGTPSTSDTPEPVTPSLTVPEKPVDPGEPVQIGTDGRFVQVKVTSKGDELPGSISEDGRTWTPSRAPWTGRNYDVAATVSREGQKHSLNKSFSTTAVKESNRLTLVMRPSNGSTVGVGAPLVVRFDQKVGDRAAVEHGLVVQADKKIEGAWHWVNDKHVRFRPKEYWPADTRVRLALQLDGVRAGDKLYGGRDYDLAFKIGDKRVAEIDAEKHTMTLTVDGKRIGTWGTSLGKPEFATRNGTYVVLSKERVRNMTACDANITCDKSHPEWYDVDSKYSVRLTWSGTFVHAAPWSRGSQGRANVSHGCINLSVPNAKKYYQYARYGDVVTVSGTSRDSDGLVSRGDPGMVDWNQNWDEIVEGSALDRSVTTQPLP